MDTSFREDVKSTLDALLLGNPAVKDGKAFGFPAYKVGRKVFAFVGGRGVGIKLGAARVNALIDSGNAAYRVFEPQEGTVWKDWLSIDYQNADDYENDEALLLESLAFVANG